MSDNGNGKEITKEEAREIWSYISKRKTELIREKSLEVGEAWQVAAMETWKASPLWPGITFEEFKSLLGKASRSFQKETPVRKPTLFNLEELKRPGDGKFIRSVTYKESLEEELAAELQGVLKELKPGWEVSLDMASPEVAKLGKKSLEKVSKKLRWGSFSSEVSGACLKVKRGRGRAKA